MFFVGLPDRLLRLLQRGGEFGFSPLRRFLLTAAAIHLLAVKRVLREHKPHILLLQETHLRAGQDTPRFPGYEAVRRDRPAAPDCERTGGGLLALFADGLWWSPTRGAPPIVAEADDFTEAQDFTIYPHQGESLRIAHLYVPPSFAGSKADPFKPEALPSDTCVFGDVNAHHESWDPNFHLRADRRGRKLRERADATGARILNTGEPTRVANSSAGVSRTAPDVSIVPQRFQRAQWRVAER
eukprot:gene13435-14014_t